MRLFVIGLLLCLPLSAKADSVIQEIIRTDNIPPLKVSYDVILKRRITKDELEKIARSIKTQNQGYERVFIGYFIAGTPQALTRNEGYWGSSHWEGNNVRLVPGPSDADEEVQWTSKSLTVPEGSTVHGRWFIPGNYGGHIVIYSNKGNTYVHQRLHDGSGSPEMAYPRKHKSGTAYRLEGMYDYFVVTDGGELELWDRSGRLPHERSVRTSE